MEKIAHEVTKWLTNSENSVVKSTFIKYDITSGMKIVICNSYYDKTLRPDTLSGPSCQAGFSLNV